MKVHRIIPHTADIRLFVEADSLPELFLGALEGMNEIICKNFCQQCKTFPLIIKLSMQATDQTALLIDFLSEVLTQSQIKKAIFCKINFFRFDKTTLEAELSGAPITIINKDIKAVTYHEAEIKENIHGNLETLIVFDI